MNRGAPPESPVQNSPSVDLRIDTIVLDGFTLGNRYDLGQAIEQELTRRFIQDGAGQLLAAAGAWERLDGGSVQVASAPTEESIGTRVAQAVYEALQTAGQHR